MQLVCHNWFIPMTLSRYWLYHLMAVVSVTIIFSAYKRKKYQDIYEAAAIRQLKSELKMGTEFQSTIYDAVFSMVRTFVHNLTPYGKLHIILKPRNVKICEHSSVLIIEQKYIYWDLENSIFYWY